MLKRSVFDAVRGGVAGEYGWAPVGFAFAHRAVAAVAELFLQSNLSWYLMVVLSVIFDMFFLFIVVFSGLEQALEECASFDLLVCQGIGAEVACLIFIER